MNCREYSQRMAEYVEGSLDGPDRLTLEEHIASCPSCRRELRLWRRIQEAVSSLPHQRAPEGFARKVMGRIGSAQRRPLISRPKLMGLVYLSAAAAALIVVGLAVLRGPAEPLQSSAPARIAMRKPPSEPAAKPAERGEKALHAFGLEISREKDLVAEASSARVPMAERLKRPSEMAAAPRARLGYGGGAKPEDEAALEPVGGGGAAGYLKKTTARRQVVLFRQVAGPAAEEELKAQAEEIHQVLNINTTEPYRVVQRAVMAANRRGIPAELAFSLEDEKSGGVVELELRLKVPVELYDALLLDMATLSGPEQQNLSNTLLGRGEFFQRSLHGYLSYQARRSRKRGVVAKAVCAAGAKPPAPPGAVQAEAREVQTAEGKALREINLLVKVLQQRPQEKAEEPPEPTQPD